MLKENVGKINIETLEAVRQKFHRLGLEEVEHKKLVVQQLLLLNLFCPRTCSA